MRCSAGEWDHISGGGGQPSHGGALADVEGELAVAHVVDLAGIVSVHDRWTPTWWHLDLDSEQGAAGLRAGRQNGDLVGAQAQPLRSGQVDR